MRMCAGRATEADWFVHIPEGGKTGRPRQSVAELRAANREAQMKEAGFDLDEERLRMEMSDEKLSKEDLLGSLGVGVKDENNPVAGVVGNVDDIMASAVSGQVNNEPLRTKEDKTSTQKQVQNPKRDKNTSINSNQTTTPGEDLDFLGTTNVLNPGDLVIHNRHGIGCFRGVERTVSTSYRPGQEIPGLEQARGGERPIQEFAVLEYRDGDVYVPFSHLEVIRKLNTKEASMVKKLDTITGAGIYASHMEKRGRRTKHAAKKKTREKIRKQLVNLHALYASRNSIQRDPFPIDHEAETAFSEVCPFTLTEDQQEAVVQVLSDMSEKSTPMDRLLCGDVGFGKTEVAMRAALRAVKAGKQVAILSPTTILAQQHFDTFTERFGASHPDITIRCMSRFVAKNLNKETKEMICKGQVQIAIGTHMLLSDTCVFKNLGLLIVDEEHRFGVNQKEKMRARYRCVDALFLSATPIPRTLHLALSGLRDTSVLRVPPFGRKPVVTQVSAVGAGLVRHAVKSEVERGGQVFYVVPRIEGIEAIVQWIQDLFPNMGVLMAHGKCSDLEQRIWSFAKHEYDVLVCTTIIENGINMPLVNTIIIQDAHQFGLAQLHQLRGRVGRCDTQAYAYLMYSETPGAQTLQSIQRLEVLAQNSSLGAGFAIAQRDMEMRGVGTVIGVEQHGNNAVEADEYARMLAEELEHARTGNPIPISLPEPTKSVEVFLPVASLIPSEYISDFNEKIASYTQMSTAKTRKELLVVAKKIQAKFGKLPPQTRRHVSVLELKLFAKSLGITRILVERQHVVMDWAVDEVAFQRLITFLPEEQARSRCQHVAGDEQVIIRGLGLCTGDVQLTTLRSFLSCFDKASQWIEREKIKYAEGQGELQKYLKKSRETVTP